MLESKVVKYTVVTVMSIALTAAIVTTIGVRSQEGQTKRQEAKVLRKGKPNGGVVNSQPTEKELDDAATPIVDLDSSDTTPVSSDRAAKGKRYDKLNLVKGEINPRAAKVVVEPPDDISDIPTDKSDLIIEGEVTDSAAFLSNDKSGVYSEFIVRVTDVLNEPSDLQIKSGDAIVTERFGGRVRYPNGQIVRYGVVGEGSPMRGKKYLFFLSKAGQGSFKILTAYEIQGDRILALDGSRTNQRGLSHSEFDKHNDESYQSFRQEVERAVRNPPSQSRRFNP